MFRPGWCATFASLYQGATVWVMVTWRLPLTRVTVQLVLRALAGSWNLSVTGVRRGLSDLCAISRCPRRMRTSTDFHFPDGYDRVRVHSSTRRCLTARVARLQLARSLRGCVAVLPPGGVLGGFPAAGVIEAAVVAGVFPPSRLPPGAAGRCPY